MRTIFLVGLAILGAGTGRDGRIDLAEFGRVVQYSGDTPETLQARVLERGVDGWEAWKGPNGQYVIALEFDEPRDLREVGIEFRHAVADRHRVKVQYFRSGWPEEGKDGRAATNPSHGEWVTAKADWWAGDRDVNFAFAPYNEEQPGPNSPDVCHRRTSRVRFLLGDRELPPVRYIHAYGPAPAAEGRFELRFDTGSKMRPPLDASVVNGFVLEGKGRVPAMETTIEDAPAELLVRYARGDLETPTRTIVKLRQLNEPRHDCSFVPAEVAKRGKVRIASLGLTISYLGAVETQPAGGRHKSPESNAASVLN